MPLQNNMCEEKTPQNCGDKPFKRRNFLGNTNEISCRPKKNLSRTAHKSPEEGNSKAVASTACVQKAPNSKLVFYLPDKLPTKQA